MGFQGYQQQKRTGSDTKTLIDDKEFEKKVTTLENEIWRALRGGSHKIVKKQQGSKLQNNLRKHDSKILDFVMHDEFRLHFFNFHLNYLPDN